MTLWKKDNEPASRSEEVAISNAVTLFIDRIKYDENLVPSFNTFYEFVDTDYRAILDAKGVRDKEFDITNFLNVLEPYYRGGEYDFCSTLTSSWTCWINGLWYSKLMQLKIILSFSGDHYYYYGNVYQQITST